jgi:enoyl-[acyl-carrier protein] reductase I
MTSPTATLLHGKTALITGVANRWSIATGIARAMHAHGAQLCFVYQSERVRDEVEGLAADLGGARCYPCDVTSNGALTELANSIRRDYGRLDTLVHSIAYANKEDLRGESLHDVPRWLRVGAPLDISSYSLIALARALLDALNDEASIMALTYLGARQSYPTTISQESQKPHSSRSSAISPTISGGAVSA